MHAFLKHICVITELYKHVTLWKSVTGRTRWQKGSVFTYSHGKDILGMIWITERSSLIAIKIGLWSPSQQKLWSIFGQFGVNAVM